MVATSIYSIKLNISNSPTLLDKVPQDFGLNSLFFTYFYVESLRALMQFLVSHFSNIVYETLAVQCFKIVKNALTRHTRTTRCLC